MCLFTSCNSEVNAKFFNAAYRLQEDGSWALNIDKSNETAIAINGFYDVLDTDDKGIMICKTYYFDENARMVTGWMKDALSNIYYFETDKSLEQGVMAIGWKQIGMGIWYFFTDDGKLFVNGVTPDGKIVGADGKWQDPNVQMQQTLLPGF